MEQVVDYEKLGLFYLGRPYDPAAKKPREGLILYKSKDLVTHAVCVGMTGSGKTGLCVGLLEEAAMDGIPAIIIDPKGDMTNLMLTFPELKPEDFLPWVNEDDARRKGLSAGDYARAQAEQWSKGLASWGQDGERIARLRSSAECLIYTPGSTAGLPISILKSLDAPSAAVLDDPELLGDRVNTTVTSLLGLMGIEADPVKSREHVLLSHLLTSAWQNGQNLDMGSLIHQIQTPPMERVGVMTVDSFFPAKDRFSLALALNNVLAAPGFSQWLEGEPLDIGSMLYSPSGKPRLSIVSVAHLSEEQRMFFVSLLLNEVVGWVRSQPGTTSLRAILYMDEIFGFFPPVANPPSKKPLLTLLKQARAYGLGVVLTTQNPVDLDYKGLANTGTWFIGRMQTERDKARVIEGLEGVSAATGSAFNRAETERLIAGLGNRIFLLNNVHENAPEVFETRWAMSYLCGPLTRTQIKQLMGGRKPEPSARQAAPSAQPTERLRPAPASTASSRPVLPPDVPQYFVPARGMPPVGYRLLYEPGLLSASQVGFVDKKTGARLDRNFVTITELTEEALAVDWSQAQEITVPLEDLERAAPAGAAFSPLPAAAGRAASYTAWKRDLATWLYGTQTIELFSFSGLKMTSLPGESEQDFRFRVVQAARERRDEETEKLRQKYEAKVSNLRNQILKAEQAVDREEEQMKQQKTQTAISLGATVLGAFLGGGRGIASSIGRMTTTARGAGRTMKEGKDIGRAEESLDALKKRMAQLEEDFRADADRIGADADPTKAPLERLTLRPSKTNVVVRVIALGWLPYWQREGGGEVRPAF
ncbi:MAG: type IV secretion system DNA-binding domain-containing protein [Dehalococcoidia bacterium]|jgi:hypothetical protein|nr:type IV secretion system DNA-binding domain-containing protein [Dehalococcoidia bacterium]